MRYIGKQILFYFKCFSVNYPFASDGFFYSGVVQHSRSLIELIDWLLCFMFYFRSSLFPDRLPSFPLFFFFLFFVWAFWGVSVQACQALMMMMMGNTLQWSITIGVSCSLVWIDCLFFWLVDNVAMAVLYCRWRTSTLSCFVDSQLWLSFYFF